MFRVDVPDIPTMVNLTVCMPSSVVIKVTPPDDNGGMPILGYRVQYNDVQYDYSTGKSVIRCAVDCINDADAVALFISSKPQT